MREYSRPAYIKFVNIYRLDRQRVRVSISGEQFDFDRRLDGERLFFWHETVTKRGVAFWCQRAKFFVAWNKDRYSGPEWKVRGVFQNRISEALLIREVSS